MKPRSAERVRAFLGAQVLFNNHNSTVDCQIRNISANGAKIQLSSTVGVPEEFDLSVPQKGRTFRCRLRWRIDDAIGVEFVEAATSADPQQGTTDRIRALEAENEALQRQLAELRARLDGRDRAPPE